LNDNGDHDITVMSIKYACVYVYSSHKTEEYRAQVKVQKKEKKNASMKLTSSMCIKYILNLVIQSYEACVLVTIFILNVNHVCSEVKAAGFI